MDAATGERKIVGRTKCLASQLQAVLPLKSGTQWKRKGLELKSHANPLNGGYIRRRLSWSTQKGSSGSIWSQSGLLRHHLFLTGRKLQLRLGHGLRSIVLPGIVSQTLRCDNDDRVIG